MSSGSNHLWHLGQHAPATPWEAEIDRLMQQQLATLDVRERKRLYDRVQAIVAEQQPFIFLATPHVLVGARGDLANFQPSVLDPYTLWNVEQLYFKPQGTSGRR
jgi:peptide/nickel transport system substrate-binding protein